MTAEPRGSPYRWFTAGVASWALAFSMNQMVFAWLVVGDLRESPRWVGAAQMCYQLPFLAFLLLGGLLADRRELRGLTTRLHVLGALVAALLAALLHGGWFGLPVLLIYGVSCGTIQALASPARDAMVSHVAGGDLLRAITGITLVTFTAIAVGARLGGLIETIAAPATLALQAAILLAGVIAVRRLPRVEPHARATGEHMVDPTGGVAPRSTGGAGGAPTPHRLAVLVDPTGGVAPRSTGGAGGALAPHRLAVLVDALRSGLREVRRSRELLPIALLVAANGLLFMGPYQVLGPLLIRELYRGDASDLALHMMAFPLGTIAGSLVMLARGGSGGGKGRAFLAAQTAVALCLVAIAGSPPFWGYLALIFAWGFFHAVFLNTSRALFQELAIGAHRGRVLAVHSLGQLGMAPISSLGSGLLAGAVGPIAGCLIMGLAMLAIIAAAFVTTGVRRLV